MKKGSILSRESDARRVAKVAGLIIRIRATVFQLISLLKDIVPT